MEEAEVIQFPKTPRVAEAMRQDLTAWRRHTAVVEEKVDGANLGVRFDSGRPVLQSRSHVLDRSGGDPVFDLAAEWARSRPALGKVLGSKYALFGEWCRAMHRVFYDALPDWFLAYDVLDRRTGAFLPTPARDEIIQEMGLFQAPRLWTGQFGKAPAFGSLIGKTSLKTPAWREAFRSAAWAMPRDETRDDSDLMEGAYVRVENESGVVGRMKLHRDGFEKAALVSDRRRIFTNQLRDCAYFEWMAAWKKGIKR